jgi:hypothetical protein
VLREAFRKAAAERKSEVKPKAELIASGPKPAERRLLRLLLDAEGFRVTLARELRAGALHAGLETEKIFAALLVAVESGERPDPAELGKSLSEKDRRLLYEIAFEPAMESSWEEAESCLAVLRGRHIESEAFEVQRKLEEKPADDELRSLASLKVSRKRELHAAEPSMEFRARVLTCVQCGAEFIFSVAEQKLYIEKGFKNDPKRCTKCRS